MFARLIDRLEKGLPGRFHLLPDFLILGAQKSGTTSLHGYMKDHPQVRFASVKEVHYFDHHYGEGERWYRSHFPTGLRRIGRRFLVGEATPSYFFIPEGPERVRETLPEARLILLLRNPVERAYSHYQHNRRAGRERESFEAVVEKQVAELRQGRPRVPVKPGPRLEYHRFSYLLRGLYAEQIERWWRFFPRSRLLILESRELFEQPLDALEQVRGFLGLRPFDWAAENRIVRALNRHPYDAMGERASRLLTEFYREPNEKLSALLDRDFAW